MHRDGLVLFRRWLRRRRGSLLRLQQRERDDVADAAGVREQHDETVDADAESAGRRHADFQGLDEVDVHLGHRFFGILPGQLRGKQFFLQPGIVELGVGVGQFHTVDVELEPLGHAGVAGLPLRERANRRGIVDEEHWSDELVFADRFEDFTDQHVVMLADGLDAELLGRGDDAGLVPHVAADVFAEGVFVLDAGPGSGEVDRLVAPGEDQAAVDFGGGCLSFRGRLRMGQHHTSGVHDDGLGEVHHRFVVAVGLVGLEHRELGIVRGVNSLVAKDAAHLVDALDAADHQPLQMQFEGDPQEQRNVEGVVVRDERPGRSAAGDRMQDRRIDLVEGPFLQRLADRLDDPAAEEQPVGHPFGVNQVDFAVAQEQFHVLRAVKLLGRLGEGLRQNADAVDEDRHFAGVRETQFAVDADDVAEVEGADQFPLRLAEVGLRHHQLDAAGEVLDVDELQLAGLGPADDASGHADRLADDARFGRSFRPRLGDREVVIESLAVRIVSEFDNAIELFETGRFEAVDAGWGRHGQGRRVRNVKARQCGG